MKKLISLLTAILMLVAVCGNVTAFSVTTDTEITPDDEAKVYSNATLEDDFADDSVMVVMSSEASLQFKTYTVDDFPEIDCVAVRDLSTGAGQRVKQEYDAMMAAELNGNAVPETVDVAYIERYNQILCIDLEVTGKENVLAAIEELEKREDIYYAGPNYVYSIAATTSSITNDTYVDDQWALDKIQLPEAWEITTGSSTVLVGVIDSGIDATHPDLAGKVNVTLSGDFSQSIPSLGVTVDINGHGTHIAGIIGAAGNNNVGVAGVCQNVTLVSLKVMDAVGEIKDDSVGRAIDYAQTMNIQVINMSFGHPGARDDTLTYEQSLENYTGIAICAAGNYGANTDRAGYFPCIYDFPNLITVGASTESDARDVDSNFGVETVDLFAPGIDILSCYPTAMCGDGTHDLERTVHKVDGYHYISGTSMAAPYVAGVAALMLSVNPNLTPAEIRWIIMLSCDKVDALTNYCVTGGRLNAYNAVMNANMYTTLHCNTNSTVALSEGEYKWFKFTATTSGSYQFYTEYTGSELDTVGELFSTLVADDSIDGRLTIQDDIETSDDGAESDYNFCIVHYLTAGETVYLRISAYDEGTCTLAVRG